LCNFGYRKLITIQAGQVSGTQTNFPVMINLASDAGLAANARPDGWDIAFTAADGTTQLSHEIESFNESTGALVAWVKIPSLSSSADTLIYMYYGDPSSPDQQNVAGVWSSGYVAVWHLSEDPSGSPPQMLDSTSNNNDGTSNGGMTSGDQVAGRADGSLDFDGSDDRINVGSIVGDRTAFTMSAWFKILQSSR
jgi:hypothetical protein